MKMLKGVETVASLMGWCLDSAPFDLKIRFAYINLEPTRELYSGVRDII